MQINHNIAALRTQNSLNKANNATDKHMRNLSSGLRINTAADDAAGMAIANKMKTQVRGLKRASMNSQDGISLVQTAEGALGEVHSMLQRMRELAVQGANGTLEAEDRRAIQMEVEQLKEEITNTSELTEFNKIKLLNGELDRRSFTDNEKISNVAYVSDTVLPGDYDIQVESIGTKAKIEGYTASYDGGMGGKISINGEEVDILATDKPEVAFEKIRDLCKRVDIKLERTDDWGTGNGRLSLQTNEAGSDKSIEIKGTSMELLIAMGLAQTDGQVIPKEVGSDAKAKLIYNANDGFQSTATVSAQGNRLIITDANYQKVYLDLAVNEDGDGLKNGMKVLSESEMRKSSAIKTFGKAAESINIGGLQFDFTNGDDLNGCSIKLEQTGVSTPPKPLSVVISASGTKKTIVIKGSATDFDTPAKLEALRNLINGVMSAGGTAALSAPGNAFIKGPITGEFKPKVISAGGSVQIGTGKIKGGYDVAPSSKGILANTANATIPGSAGINFTILDAGPLQLQVGANEGMKVEIQIPELTSTALGLEFLNMRTEEAAGKAITLCDNAIAEISAVRSKLGAYQNRLEYTINNLDSTSENTTAALSRIEDADMAYEMAEYTQKNTISQAGVNMLKQANQRPQQVMQLLQ